MAKHSYLLKVEKPCTQNWSTMSRNEKGRFCTHCSKTVIDLTRLSDSEILQIIKNTSGGICGRLTQEEPEREILVQSKAGIRGWYSKLIAGLLLLIASKRSIASVHQLQQEIIKTADLATNNNKTQEANCVSDTTKKKIHGKVIDADNKEPLIGATVNIKNTKLSVLANEKGEFEFSVTDSLLPKKIILVVSYIGYQTTEFAVKRRDIEKGKYFLIKPTVSILGFIAFNRNW